MTKFEALYRVAPSTDTLDHLEIEQGPPRRYTFLRRALLTDRFITTSLTAICLFGLAFGLGVTTTLAWTSADYPESYWLTRMKEMSPITPDIPLSHHEQRFNGSLLMETIYRQNASEEVDKAWQALGIDYRSVVVPAGIAGRIGIADDQVKISSRHGGGYVANVEGLHQLHCLNLLRQSLWFNYDYYAHKGQGAFKNNEYILQKHVTHCLDILRQQLMCTVDIGVLGQVWWQSDSMAYPEAYVDFNTRHICRNFEDVRIWAEKHQVSAGPIPDFLEPPGPNDRVYHELP